MAEYPSLAYRVMSTQEFLQAAQGLWSDGKYVRGDPDEEGRKWLWMTLDAARHWLSRVASHGEADVVVTAVSVRRELSVYPMFDHPPEGIAVHVPFEDLGPATLVSREGMRAL